jgi:sulfatase maturation enzyme AslB (radical SAM superfamily)
MRKPSLDALTFERLPFPEDVIVETFAYCNLRCIMCPYPNLQRSKGEMSFDVFKKIVDEMAMENPCGRLWVAILGEPFLRPEKQGY